MSEIPIDPRTAPYRFLKELIDNGVHSFSTGTLKVLLMPDADLGCFGHDIVVGIWDGDELIEAHTIEPETGHGNGMVSRNPPVIPVYRESWFFSHEGAVITALWVQAQLANQVPTTCPEPAEGWPTSPCRVLRMQQN